MRASRRALSLWVTLGDRVAEGGARVVLSRSSFMAGRSAEAVREAERAVAVLQPTGDLEALAYAETYLGAVQALTDRQDEALTRLLEAQALAAQAGRRDLVALCHNYIGCARIDLGDVDTGLADLHRSLRLALDLPHHEYAGRAYTNLAETTYQLHRYDELARWIDEGARFTVDHDLPGHLHNLEAHRALLLLGRGQWDEAQTRLERLVSAGSEPDQLTRLTLAPLGRLLARRGDDRAADLLERAWDLALHNGSLAALGAGGARSRRGAWLAGDVDDAGEQIRLLLERTAAPGGARTRGELLRYLSRAGRPVETFDGLPAGVGRGPRRRLAAGRRRLAARSATPTNGRSSSRPAAARWPAWRRWTCWTSWARWLPPGWSGPACASSARRGSRGAGCGPPGRTRPGSPSARSTSWPCWPPG